MVADELGNTPNVCRSYYIHPNFLLLIVEKSLPNKFHEDDGMKQFELTSSEKEVMKHL